MLEILPVSTFEDAVRVEFFGDEIDRIVEFDVLTGEVKRNNTTKKKKNPHD